MIKYLGGTPSFMGGGEVYMALQRGTVDGAVSSVSSFADRKYYEVTKYVTEPNVFYSGYMCLINLQKWNSLPEEIQKIFLAAGKDTQEFGKRQVREEEDKATEEIKSKGMEIYYLPKPEREAWKKACKPMEDLFIAKVGDPLGRKLISLVDKVR
jgi:TRAP-type C4-dicarboxylate transport system substrate-binding protein